MQHRREYVDPPLFQGTKLGEPPLYVRSYMGLSPSLVRRNIGRRAKDQRILTCMNPRCSGTFLHGKPLDNERFRSSTRGQNI
jgi:hypothetical protein